MLQFLLVFPISFLVLSPTVCVAKDFHVTPYQSQDISPQSCPLPCYSIEHYAQNTESLFSNHTNISIIFLPGTHHLYTDITISGRVVLSLQALETESPNNVTVINVNFTSIRILDTLAVTIDRLTLKGVTITVLSPILLLIENSHWVQSCLKVQTQGINLTDVRIEESNFQGGNSVENGVEVAGKHINLSILNSSILQYSQFGLKLDFRLSLGLGEILISNLTLCDNPHGLSISGPLTSLSVEGSTVCSSSVTGILLLFHVKMLIIHNTTCTKNNLGLFVTSTSSSVSIQDVIFDQNEIAMGIIPPFIELAPIDRRGILINRCTFSSSRQIGIGLLSIFNQPVTFKNCNFHDNKGTSLVAFQSKFGLSKENVFKDNTADRGGGLALYNSTVTFEAGSNTTFINNTAREYGGAIYAASLPLVGGDLHSFEQMGTIMIVGYSAVIDYVSPPCFYNQTDNSSLATFSGNTADLGGMDIYGLTLRSYFPELDCKVSNNNMFHFDDSIPSIFQIASDPTRVCFCDSDANCDETNLIMNMKRFPGETFAISVVLIGFKFGRVTGGVYTTVNGGRLVGSNQNIQKVDKQCSEVIYTLASNEPKNKIILTLTSQEQFTSEGDIQERLDFLNVPHDQCNSSTTSIALLNTPIYVNITLEECPLGFDLDSNSTLQGVCDCDLNIARLNRDALSNITCKIQNRTGFINITGRVWVGVDNNSNNTDVYYWHRNCPNNYCKLQVTNVNLLYPDSQCTSNRSGVLCGKCQEHYSLQLGGNKCVKCDNHYLALVTIFAILGIVLVGFIKILNLTVADGTINGLIFYANVVWRNNAIFSPTQTRNIGYYIITVPIAWINLDFGIETCFSESLDQLTKTGLQFVFPVYIWCIACFMILVSHYSTRATKLFGSNSVAVLATLLLLSYGKVLRNITDIFTFSYVDASNGAYRKVWSLDGNVLYGQTPGHAVLISVACVFLLLFIVPFTLVLLSVPFIRKKSHLRPLHWISNLKPFFDAFYSPLSDKKQYHVWPGMLLLSRVVILIVFPTVSALGPNGSILLMIFIATILLLYTEIFGQIYKKRCLAQHEILYLINLIVLGGVNQTLSSVLKLYDINAVETSSICIALIQFVVILLISRRKKIILSGKKIITMVILMTKRKRRNNEEVNSANLKELKTPTHQSFRFAAYDPSHLQDSTFDIN